MKPSNILIVALTQAPYLSTAAPTEQYCKPQPGDRHWPTAAEWQSLNASVSGRLSATVPAGAVCHPSWPQFNHTACLKIQDAWKTTNFHALNSVSVDYNDITCLPNATAPCSDAGYPRYVIEAESAKDVERGVAFAHKTGVRLVVKGTGHDYPGRSSGPDSLLIWTHNIRGIEVIRKLDSSSDIEPAALVKLYAGERFINVMTFAADNHLTPIAGADPHVGVGGWFLGGGHGPLTGKYGMGADQLIEMEVVTADGVLRTVNAEADSDLFWALRGSGGSTYAVIISFTVRMYPTICTGHYLFAYNTTSDTDTFWSMAAYFHSQMPMLTNASIFGYYSVIPLNSELKDASMQGQVTGELFAPSNSGKYLESVMAPINSHIKQANWGDPVYVGGITNEYPDFAKYWKTRPPQPAGFSARLGSRLLDEKALTGDIDKLKSALRTSTPPGYYIDGHLVAGPGTHNPPNGIPGGSDAVGPAWRTAYAHLALPRQWEPFNQSEFTTVTDSLRDVQTHALRKLAPDTGAYVNEVDPTEPDWHFALYGDNFDRLSDIKKKWDPKGVFWCKHCIGSDAWEQIGEYGINNGVGQNQVKLCWK